ncbi:MAG: hypothetical protein HZC41_26375 [Chloroflexi bacterium]|nr:hypothetical protein [Chloroflexota bacterium]
MKKMIVLLTVLLLTIGGSAFAQLPPGFCGGLSEADCQLFTASTEAMAKLESASMDASLDLTVSNIPDAPFDSLAFNLRAEGVYHVEPGLMEKYAAMQSDPAALFQNLSQLPKLLEDLFAGFDGQMNLVLTLPDELVALAEQSETALPSTLAVDLMLVDGVGYINLSSLAEALPEAGIPSGWYGLEIAKLLGNVMEMSMSELEDLDMSGFDPSTFSQFYDPAFLESYLKLERLADSDGAAVFQMTMDMAALMENPAFRDLMKQQMEATGQTMSEADVDAALEMVARMYEGLDMQAIYTINLNDSTMRGMDMTFNWDMASLMDAVGESAAAAPVITMNLSATYSDFNAAPAITAPADATVMTAEEAMQMFMGGMEAAPKS